MKKIALFAVSCFLINSLLAQDSTLTVTSAPVKKKKTPIDLSGRANDHFMVQLGYTGWAGKPDTINTSGFSKSFNVYFMFDFPFKSNPKLSMAFGPGISSDHIIFKKTYVGIKDITETFQFRDQSDTNHFKKTKLNTTYLEAPVEFRYVANPLNSDKSFKFAIGAKVGTMIKAHTRNKDFENKNGNTLNSYTMKESSKRFFNTTRLVGTARVGLGHFSLYGSYQITTLFKEGVAAEIRPFSIGLTISGL
ncbi:MAG TPA: outer membrane beta-barrel protein [Chitinophagaceae bacterium]|nr:outer membrane beta-barrel protein [Chitinophagaceae bacterium]